MAGGYGAGDLQSNGIFPKTFIKKDSEQQGPGMSLVEKLLQRLVNRLAPDQQNYPIISSNQAVGTGSAIVRYLNSISINGIIATVAQGEIWVYFTASAIDGNSVPDFIFNSNSSTVYIPLPAGNYDTVNIVAVGSQPATYSVRLIQY